MRVIAGFRRDLPAQLQKKGERIRIQLFVTSNPLHRTKPDGEAEERNWKMLPTGLKKKSGGGDSTRLKTAGLRVVWQKVGALKIYGGDEIR